MVAIATITPLPWLRAQEPAVPPAVVGQRVRVRHCEGRRCTAVTGILRDVGTDGLRIEVVPDSVPVVAVPPRRDPAPGACLACTGRYL